MGKRSFITGILAVVALVALPNTALALTCPASIGGATGFDRQYTVDPALACVYGGGEINNAGQDDFLSGPLTTPPNEGIWGGTNIDLILGSPNTTGAVAGWTAENYTFGTNPGTSGGNVTIPNFDPTKEYLIGIKDGNQSPGWAVFLVNQSTVFWQALSEGGGNAWSHGVLYSRDGGGGGNGGTPPEPASLLLFGFGMVAAAHRLRKRSR